jgi:hypothetical protein
VLAGRARNAEGKRASEHSRETFNAARDSFLALAKALNGGNRKHAIAGLLEGITHEHRYLQNEGIWSLLTALGAFGGLPERFTDARNASSHKACKDLRTTLGDRIYWPEFD